MNSKFWELYESISERVKLLIDVIKFGSVVRVGYIIYHSLVTILIERWKPETIYFILRRARLQLF